MLKRKRCKMFAVIVTVLLCGCGGTKENDKSIENTTLEEESDRSIENVTLEEENDKGIENVTWEKKNDIQNGIRVLKFVCNNGSDYRIRSVAVNFIQKDSTSVEMLNKYFSDYIKNAELSSDDVKDIYLYGYVADEMQPGDTLDGYFAINASLICATEDSQYELFEPDIMTIRYYTDDTDDSEKVAYYDYKCGEYRYE